jgi:hypothetical protein
MPVPVQRERVAVLWTLSWSDESVLACSVYRDPFGLQLCVESNAAIVLSEPFELEPRAVARAHALRDSLKRRGWVDR